MDADKIKQLAGNLRHAAWTGKGATIGGGKFSAAECKAAGDALYAAPAMLAALQDAYAEIKAWRSGLNARNMNKCKVGATFADERNLRAAIAAATGESVGAPTGESGAAAPIVAIRADHLAALIGAAESYAEDLETGLADGTYDDRADLDAVQAAIAAIGEG